MDLTIAEPSLVVLVGIAGAGKSTFAAQHFRGSETVSSDGCRSLVADDPADQDATGPAFSLLTFILDKRLRRRRLTVVDATNCTARERRRLLGLARKHGIPGVALVFDLPLAVCQERNAARVGRTVAPAVLERQQRLLQHGLERLPHEGFQTIHVLHTPSEVQAVRVVRVPASDPTAVLVSDPAPAPPPPETRRRPAVIVDADDDLAVSGGAVPSLLGGLAGRLDVVAVSRRPLSERDAVVAWLDARGVHHDVLVLRDNGDQRDDDEVKADLVQRRVTPSWDPVTAITASESLAARWRDLGITVLAAQDPAPGAGPTPRAAGVTPGRPGQTPG